MAQATAPVLDSTASRATPSIVLCYAQYRALTRAGIADNERSPARRWNYREGFYCYCVTSGDGRRVGCDCSDLCVRSTGIDAGSGPAPR